MKLQCKCANGRKLVVCDKSSAFTRLNELDVVPSVVLLTAWQKSSVSMSDWHPQIKELLARGCTYFVCAGTFAEELHDIVDEIISTARVELIATTFHPDETAEDVVNFFIYTTTIPNGDRNALVAILDITCNQDVLLMNLAEQECNMDI